MADRWSLAIDVGTTSVKASIRDDSTEEAHVLWLAQNGPSMPAGVYVESPSSILVGARAVDRAAGHPAGYMVSPRRAVGYPAVTINGYDLDPGEPVRAVYAHVLEQAVAARARATGAATRPARLVLTHPAEWSADAVRVLHDAAHASGFTRDQVVSIAEMDALTRTVDLRSAVGAATAAVVDVGGGSVDVGVVDMPSLACGASGRDELLGAEGFDAAVRRWLDQHFATVDPALVHALRSSATPAETAALANQIARARLSLAQAPAVHLAVAVGHRREQIALTAQTYGSIVAEQVDRIAALIESTVGPSGVGTVTLSGGAARIPSLLPALQRRWDVSVDAEPETAVVRGALIADREGATSGYPESAPTAMRPVGTQPGYSLPPPAPTASVGGGGGRSKRKLFVAVGAGLVVAALAAGAVLAQTVFAGGDDERAAVEDVASRWLSAVGAGDAAALEPLTCAEKYGAMKGAKPVEGQSLTLQSLEELTIEGDTATALANADAVEPDMGAYDMTSRMVFEKRDGQWRVCSSRTQ